MTATLVLLATVLYAQPNKQRRTSGPQGSGIEMMANKLDLSDDQKSKLEELTLANQKKMKTFQNQLREKRAALITLTTADDPDRKAVNKTVEEIGSLETSVLKQKTNHQLEVRSMLSDKQKMIWDQMQTKFGRKRGMGVGFKQESGQQGPHRMRRGR